jgi:hypothetical protein
MRSVAGLGFVIMFDRPMFQTRYTWVMTVLSPYELTMRSSRRVFATLIFGGSSAVSLGLRPAWSPLVHNSE